MMHKFHELLREADIHKKTKMVENQTDSHTANCWSAYLLVSLFLFFIRMLGLPPQKQSLNLRISSANVKKSTDECGFVLI